MRHPVRLAGMAAAIAVAAAIVGAAALPDGRAAGALAVRDGGRWTTWWHPGAETADRAALAQRIAWRTGPAGIEWGDLELSGAGEAWRTRVIVVRLDPRQVALQLVPAFDRGTRWSVGDAAPDAALALDAGQFRGALPYGWVMTGGREILPPERAPLAGAVVVDRSGAVRVVPPDRVAAERATGEAREAFQSYPMLLQDGVVPLALREAGHGVVIGHRDGRLALGTMVDGRVVIALTRFDALGPALGRVPFGLTSGEMAVIMEGLGCRQALLLDGGISGQLMVRAADGTARAWPGTRSVPLGLVGRPRR
ncbi:MAG: phosphodiester glycosidase family protein [Gemmatimonadales bacterium]